MYDSHLIKTPLRNATIWSTCLLLRIQIWVEITISLIIAASNILIQNIQLANIQHLVFTPLIVLGVFNWVVIFLPSFQPKVNKKNH